MSTQNEEIKITFGAETSTLDQALRKLKNSLKETGEHGEKSFVHAGNGARQLHHVIHELTAQAPILGGALQAAISPIAGAFLAAGMAASFVFEKLKEWNAEMDKIGTEAAKPTRDIKEAMRESRKAIEEARREYEKFLKTLEPDEADKARHKLDESLATLGQKSKAAMDAAKAGGNPEEAARIEKRHLELEFLMRSQALQAASNAKLKLTGSPFSNEPGLLNAAEEAKVKADANLKNRTDNAAKANADEERLKKQIEERLEKEKAFLTKLDIGGEYPEKQEDIESQQRLIEDLETQLKGTKNRIEKNKDAVDRETRVRNGAADRLEELTEQYKKQHALFESLSNELEQSRLKLSAYTQAVDTRNNPTRAAGEATDALQQKTTDWMTNQNQKIANWNMEHGIAPAMMKDALGVIHRPTPAASAETMLKNIDGNMDALLKLAQAGGLVVKAKD